VNLLRPLLAAVPWSSLLFLVMEEDFRDPVRLAALLSEFLDADITAPASLPRINRNDFPTIYYNESGEQTIELPNGGVGLIRPRVLTIRRWEQLVEFPEFSADEADLIIKKAAMWTRAVSTDEVAAIYRARFRNGVGGLESALRRDLSIWEQPAGLEY
jgi:hypothetical protein